MHPRPTTSYNSFNQRRVRAIVWLTFLLIVTTYVMTLGVLPVYILAVQFFVIGWLIWAKLWKRRSQPLADKNIRGFWNLEQYKLNDSFGLPKAVRAERKSRHDPKLTRRSTRVPPDVTIEGSGSLKPSNIRLRIVAIVVVVFLISPLLLNFSDGGGTLSSTSSIESIWLAYHWMIISCTVLMLLFLTGLMIWHLNLISWNILSDLKAIPIGSPVFCFGAPVFWSKNLAYASLGPKLLATYSSLSITAGIVFLFYLILYGLLNHKFKEKSDSPPSATENPVGIVDRDGKPIINDQTHTPSAEESKRRSEVKTTCICLGVFGLGLGVMLVVLLDVVCNILFSNLI